MSSLQVGQVPQPEITAVGQRVLPQNVSPTSVLNLDEWRLTEDIGASPVLTVYSPWVQLHVPSVIKHYEN